MFKAIRAYLYVESNEIITVFTGQLVKTLIYAITKELRIFRGIRGIVSPIHISPLFRPGTRDFTLGEVITPIYETRDKSHKLKPVEINGEYIIHIGGDAMLVEKIAEDLSKIKNPLTIKFYDNLVTFKLQDSKDVTKEICSKHISTDKVTLYLKAPVKPFNIYTPSRLPKFSISALEILMVPYMLYRGAPTLTDAEVLEAMKVLGLLVETYYSMTTTKPILIPYKSKEPAMIGKITYIIDTRKDDKKREIKEILNIAEIIGIGESRQNGFGTITWTEK